MKFTDAICEESTFVLANLSDSEVNEIALMTVKSQLERLYHATKVTGDTVLAIYLREKASVLQHVIEAKNKLNKSSNPEREDYREELSAKHIF